MIRLLPARRACMSPPFAAFSPLSVFRPARWPAALLLGFAVGLVTSCGPKEPTSTLKKEGAQVATESGPLPAAGTAQRLRTEQSPFLRRHAEDPVDWYPWGEEAFAKARAEQKLVLVSVGYASCPWSLKMQQDSFSDPAVARFMNRHYVNILVDREERPDVNNSYLHFVVWKNKQSGWPLHLWLTPEGLPVFSGVYFAAQSVDSRPSWTSNLEYVANSFREDPAYVKRQAEAVARDYLKEYRKFWQGTDLPLKPDALAMAFEKLRALYDPVNGGFSGAPKFPQPHALNYLMAYAARIGADRMGRSLEAKEMVGNTLDGILKGGIYDQLDGGIHRYSTDNYWAVPQFEKMLYDQGVFAETLTHAAVSLGRAQYIDAAREILRYTEQTLGHADGAFYSAEGSSSAAGDGDPSLSEGAYYLWQYDEVARAAGDAAMPLLRQAYGLDERGNLPIDSPVRARFPGANVLRLDRPLAELVATSGRPVQEVGELLKQSRSRLLEARQKRPRPLLDDKILASWNGTVISALARGGWVLDDAAMRDRAGRAADFILKRLRRPDGTLIHAWLDGPSTAPGYAEDYASVIRSLLDLYETTGALRWLQSAAELQDVQIAQLWDSEEYGFFDGPAQPLVFNRMKSVDESTEFSPTSVSTMNLIRLSSLLGRADYREKAQAVVKAYGSLMMRTPAGFLRALQAYDSLVHPPVQVVVSGDPEAPDRAGWLTVLRRSLPFGRVVIFLDGREAQAWLTQSHPALGKLPAAPAGRTTVHLCLGSELRQTVDQPGELAGAIAKLMAPPAP